jgi:hypothetical protein
MLSSMHGAGKSKGKNGLRKDLQAVAQSASTADLVSAYHTAVHHNGELLLVFALPSNTSACAQTHLNSSVFERMRSCCCHDALMLLLPLGIGVPKGATMGKICIALISGNVALQTKKEVH